MNSFPCNFAVVTQGTKTIEENFEIKPVDIDSCFDAMGERICKVDTSVSGRSDYQLLVHSKCAFPGERYCTWKDRKPGVRVNDTKLKKFSPRQILVDCICLSYLVICTGAIF